MKITPLEIRQKTFEKIFRGYDKDEVNAFLYSMSHEWEKLMDEQKELRIKLEAAEKEINKLREVETSLYKTLKTAEDTGANMIQQANKAAELRLKETEMKAENMVREAKAKSKEIVEKTEQQARSIIGRMLEEAKTLEQNFSMAKNLNENLLSDLRNLANETIDRTRKFQDKASQLNIDKLMKEAREYADNYEIENFDLPDIAQKTTEKPAPGKKPEPPEHRKDEGKPAQQKSDNSEKSFFDLID
jgi:cell division initiation protein